MQKPTGAPPMTTEGNLKKGNFMDIANKVVSLQQPRATSSLVESQSMTMTQQEFNKGGDEQQQKVDDDVMKGGQEPAFVSEFVIPNNAKDDND